MDSDLSAARPTPDSDGMFVLGSVLLGFSIPFCLGVLWAAQSMLARTGEPGYENQWAGDAFLKCLFVPGVLAFGVPGLACWLRTPRVRAAGPRSTTFRALGLLHAIPLLFVFAGLAWKLLAGPHREAARRDTELPWMIGGWLLLAAIPLLVAGIAFARGRWSGRMLFRIAGLGSLAWVWAAPLVLLVRSLTPAADFFACLMFYAPLTIVAILLVAGSFSNRPPVNLTAAS